MAALNQFERETVPNQQGIESLKRLNLKADVIGTAKTFSGGWGELENVHKIAVKRFKISFADRPTIFGVEEYS
jgi:ABC-type phosphate/phosphonate transport system ATPase subunit